MKTADQVNARVKGFTLTELLIAMAVGLVVMTGAAQLFNTGMSATQAITQRAEMQENTRAALNLIAKDASMAGSGIPSGGLTLPYGAGNNGVSLFAVDTTGKVWLNNDGYLSGYGRRDTGQQLYVRPDSGPG